MRDFNTRIAFDVNERVLVIGLGRSGRATAHVLRGRGVTVFATDENSSAVLHSLSNELERENVAFVEPEDLAPVLEDVTVAVISPGVPMNGALVRRVQSAGIPVFSEIEVAYRLCKAPIAAITGTKGKTTTTALLGAIFRGCGKTAHVGGNIGNALINETVAAKPEDWVVAEVSSFQLEAIRSFKPRLSTILNISPDHLDRYHSMNEYAEAKFRIFANQGPGDTFVGNLDDPIVSALAEGDGAARIRCSSLWFAREPHRRTTLYLRNGERIVYAPPTGDPRPVEIMPVSEIPLAGMHNVENVMAAILTALAAGLDPAAIRAAVRRFEALPHRLQRVAEINGVLFVDDSKATNPGSAIAALQAFGERPLVLIAGGKAKGTDFGNLGEEIDRRAAGAVLIGEAADEIARSIQRAPVERATSMEDAVARATALAAPLGAIVLLSPACASFDMFTSAEARGNAFIAAVAARTKTARHGGSTLS